MTGIFIVALGYDLWYYVLGYAGIIEYKMNTPIQKIGKEALSTPCYKYVDGHPNSSVQSYEMTGHPGIAIQNGNITLENLQDLDI